METNDGFIPTAAGLLLRVSTSHQAQDGLSLVDQERIGREIAARYGVPVVGVFSDAGVSGDLFASRNGLQDALSGLRAGAFNLLIAYDLSRVTWSPEHQPRIFREIFQAGGRLHVHLMGGIIRPDDYQQEFFAGMQTQADRFYRRHIRAACTTGLRNKAIAGRQPARRHSPYGFHVVTKADVIRGTYPEDSEGTYQTVDIEASAVRKMYEWYTNEGLTLMEIARRLKAEGHPTKQGGEWGHSVVYKILRNPVYKGVATYGNLKRYKDETRKGKISEHTHRPYTSMYYWLPAPEPQKIYIPITPLVDEATWDKAQARFEQNKKRLSGRADRKNLLTGIIVCPFCGIPMNIGCGGAKYHYYVCRHSNPKQPTGGVFCSARCYGRDACDDLVVGAVQAAITHAAVLQSTITEWIGECAVKQAELARLPASGSPAFDAERQALQEEIDGLERRRRDVASLPNLDVDFLAGLLRELSEAWKSAKAKLSAYDNTPRAAAAPTAKSAAPKADALWFTKDVTEAFTKAESVLRDERVPKADKWLIMRGLVQSVVPVYAERPKGSPEPRVTGAEVTFAPIFEGDGETVANVKNWAHRDDFAPIVNPDEKADFLQERTRTGRFPSAELLVPDTVALAPLCVALHTENDEMAEWIAEITEAVQPAYAPPVLVSPALFPGATADFDWEPFRATLQHCVSWGIVARALGENAPPFPVPPDLPFD